MGNISSVICLHMPYVAASDGIESDKTPRIKRVDLA